MVGSECVAWVGQLIAMANPMPNFYPAGIEKTTTGTLARFRAVWSSNIESRRREAHA
jgi:hypothetical protein